MKYGLIPQSASERSALEQAPQARVLLEPFLPVVLARALLAFVELGLARSLAAEGKSAAELAVQLGLQQVGVRQLLRVLAAAGYVSLERRESSATGGEKAEDVFQLTPLSRATLTDDACLPLTEWVRHNAVHWRVLSNLERIVAGQQSPDLHGYLHGAEEWAVYQQAMWQTALPASESVAQQLPEPAGRQLLLDLGRSHGLYGAAICRRFPPMRSRVIELPEAIEHARALGERANLAALVEYQAGDIRHADLGNQVCDVVFMGNIAHHLSDAELMRVLRIARRSLKPGGLLAIWDIAVPTSEPDLVAESFSLLFYLSSASGGRSPARTCRLLGDSGFARVEIQPGPAATHLLITGCRL